MWDLPGSGIKPVSPALAGRFFTTESPGKHPPFISEQWLGQIDTEGDGWTEPRLPCRPVCRALERAPVQAGVSLSSPVVPSLQPVFHPTGLLAVSNGLSWSTPSDVLAVLCLKPLFHRNRPWGVLTPGPEVFAPQQALAEGALCKAVEHGKLGVGASKSRPNSRYMLAVWPGQVTVSEICYLIKKIIFIGV